MGTYAELMAKNSIEFSNLMKHAEVKTRSNSSTYSDDESKFVRQLSVSTDDVSELN
jgi:hypothetical protein